MTCTLAPKIITGLDGNCSTRPENNFRRVRDESIRIGVRMYVLFFQFSLKMDLHTTSDRKSDLFLSFVFLYCMASIPAKSSWDTVTYWQILGAWAGGCVRGLARILEDTGAWAAGYIAGWNRKARVKVWENTTRLEQNNVKHATAVGRKHQYLNKKQVARIGLPVENSDGSAKRRNQRGGCINACGDELC